VRIDSIPLSGISAADVGRWGELAAAAAAPNPFFEPEYVLALARGLGQEAEVRLLVAEQAGEWLGCLPIHSPGRWHQIPLRGVATWRGHELYGLLGTPLIAAEGRQQTVEALLDGLLAACPAGGFAALDWLAQDGELGEELGGALGRLSPRPVEFERFERAALERRPEPTYLEETLSSKRRRELRRQSRKLGEALGGEPELVERGGEGAAVETLMALESSGRKGERGTVLASDAGHARFFTEMCRGFAELGRLQMLELRCGGKTVAAKCNLRAGDTLFMFKIAFDDEWAAHSPGILLEREMLKFFHQKTDARSMDSCADPNNAMINRLWPDRRTIASYALPARGASGNIVRTALVGARSLRDRKAKRREA
jgi:CelD/BcsL family acetyltransferase involved in cellulose biosynthesis